MISRCNRFIWACFQLFKAEQLNRSRHGLWADGWDSIHGRGVRFSLFQKVQTGSGAHPTSYPMKWPLSEAEHSPQSRAEVKNGGAILPLPNTSSCHGA
jgi:hypothetical protein